MPLTKRGRRTYAAMLKKYGKRQGKRVFYAYAHSHPGLHGKRRKK